MIIKRSTAKKTKEELRRSKRGGAEIKRYLVLKYQI
jgi:hypothetical protein